MKRLGLPLALLALLSAGCGSSKSQSANTATGPSGALTSASRISAREVPQPVPAKAKPKPKPKAKPKAAAKKKTKSGTTTKTSTTAASTTTGSTTTPSTSTPSSTPAATGATLDAKSSLLGTILVDADGRTLYLFKDDAGSDSSCYGSCETVWPPFTTNGSPVAGAGVQASLLGTTTRHDGKTQVTYDGHPLYYFAGDSTAGATNGQGIKQFGAKWWVVSPAGHAVKRR